MSDGAGLPAARQPPLHPLPPPGRWAVLLLASLLVGGALQLARLPAAPLLGPLAAAVLVQALGGKVAVPRKLLAVAQAVIGCLVARSITPAILGGFLQHWPVFLAVVALSLVASAAIGWAMSRLRIIPGSTAVWGILPGAATVMMVMAEAYGADFRLVAFMQYLRVVLVAAAASVLGLLFTQGGGGRFSAGFFPPLHLLPLAETTAIAVGGGLLGAASRIPAGVLLGPLLLGAALNLLGWAKIELPPTVLIASYALVGWNTGLRFTRDVLTAAARALPQTLGATLLLMACCGGLAAALSLWLHIDPLTAYLATSPGGIDAAAIIAASAHVDTPFVMALQTVRVLTLVMIGPKVAQWVAGTLDRTPPRPAHAPPLDLGEVD